MIIVRLFGGLGNQMFQYAFAKNLSIFYNVPLKFDLRLLDKDSEATYQQRIFELDNFGIAKNQATKNEISKFLAPNRNIIPRVLAKGYHCFFNYQIEIEKTFTYYESVFAKGPNLYLDGFWQSEKYFKQNQNQIRADFSFPSFSDKQNLSISQEITKTASVSIHIRRGDYLKMASATQSHPVCSLEYYYNAINRISETIENPRFYFFSDDIEWVESQFANQSNHVFINHNKSQDSYRDMQLMSLCKHNIIANSSFSWWGAWLNENPNKIVIAPKNWFKNTSIDTTDLIPSTWIRL
jgi:hypothetical protein